MTKGIRQTAKGWEVSLTHQHNRKTAVCRTKAEAIAKRKEFETLLRCTPSSAPVAATVDSGITIGQAAERCLRDRWANIKSVDAVHSYLKQVRDFIGDDTPLMSLDRLDLAAMQKYYLDLGNRPRTVNKKVGIIKSLFKDALADRLIPYIPAFPKELRTQEVKDRVFSKEEEALFIEWFQKSGREEMADILQFLLDTCARWGEVEKLKVWDVDLRAKRVTFEDRKANNLGSVPLTARALAIGKKYQGSQGRMFSTKYWSFNEAFNQAKDQLGIHDPRLTPHCTRHTCATRLAEGNISLAMIMTYGGWTSLKSVKRYLHVQTDALSPCIEVLEG